MKTTENTTKITLNEKQISFLKLSMVHGKFEEGGQFKKDMIKIFEELHKEILQEKFGKKNK